MIRLEDRVAHLFDDLEDREAVADLGVAFAEAEVDGIPLDEERPLARAVDEARCAVELLGRHEAHRRAGAHRDLPTGRRRVGRRREHGLLRHDLLFGRFERLGRRLGHVGLGRRRLLEQPLEEGVRLVVGDDAHLVGGDPDAIARTDAVGVRDAAIVGPDRRPDPGRAQVGAGDVPERVAAGHRVESADPALLVDTLRTEHDRVRGLRRRRRCDLGRGGGGSRCGRRRGDRCVGGRRRRRLGVSRNRCRRRDQREGSGQEMGAPHEFLRGPGPRSGGRPMAGAFVRPRTHAPRRRTYRCASANS
jgi:hypothetical protein